MCAGGEEALFIIQYILPQEWLLSFKGSLSPQWRQEGHSQSLVLSNLCTMSGLNFLAEAVDHKHPETAKATAAFHRFTAQTGRIMGSRDGAVIDPWASRGLPKNQSRKDIYWAERNGASNWSNWVTGKNVLLPQSCDKGNKPGKKPLNAQNKAQMNTVPCSGWSMGDILHLLLRNKVHFEWGWRNTWRK